MRDQVKGVAFAHGVADLVIEELTLGHPTRQRAHGRPPGSQRALHLIEQIFADIAHRPLEVDAEHHVQVAGGVGVDRQDCAGSGSRSDT